MVKQYRFTRARRIGNVLMSSLIRLGLKRGSDYLLTVPGRKTGNLHTTPVTLVEADGERWLVAPYGEVDWVRNARAAGEVMIRQGRTTESLQVSELSPEESGPVLKRYVQNVPIVRSYFNAKPDAPVSDFVAEAQRHPVFRLTHQE